MKFGDLGAALRDADDAGTRKLDQQSPWAWRFRTLKAEILMRQGIYGQSLALLDAEIPSALASSDLPVWRELTAGSACAYLERYPEADRHLLRAQQLAEAAHPQLLSEVYLRRGTLASLQWDYNAATALYHATLDLAKKQDDPFLETAALGSLGLEASRIEHFDESIDWNEQALQLSKSVRDVRSVSRIEGNLGWSYYKLGDLANALDQFRQAESDANRSGLAADAVYWLVNAASAAYDSNNYAAAQADAQRALGLAKNLGDRGATIGCLQVLALVAMAQERPDLAGQFLGEASEQEKSSPDPQREIYTHLILAQLAAKRRDFDQAAKLYTTLSRDQRSPASVRWEAQAGLAQLHAAQGQSGLAQREFGESTDTISKARRALQHEDFRLSFLSSAIRFYDAYVNFLIDQNRPLEALRIADLSRAQTLEDGLTSGARRSLQPRAALDPRAISRRLRATILFYWLGEKRSYLWTVTPTGIHLSKLPPGREIAAAVGSYRRAFLDPQDPLESGNPDGKKLYSVLVQPAEKSISGNARVIILPDGALNALNFEALVVSGEKPHYWIEDATITTANSLALLSRAALTLPPRDGRLLLVGDALPASADFPPLPQAGREIRLLENYFTPPQRLELTGADATAKQFLASRPEQFAYLHFATHGTASRTRPLESAVILSPQADSYKLYARDVLKRPFGAYLVTISACNGAGSKSYAGEGLVGLSWAFLRAGAHNVIAGLWEVSNASTPQLMDELYKGLRAGEDPAAALRHAKLSLVHSSGNYRKPFYWAPFLLYSGS